jgi:hypothetical protein
MGRSVEHALRDVGGEQGVDLSHVEHVAQRPALRCVGHLDVVRVRVRNEAEGRGGVFEAADQPAAVRAGTADLADRRWVRLPDGADPVWTAYWTGGAHDDASPVMRTIQECLRAVVWNGTSALAPVDQPLPTGLVVVPLADRPPSEIVVAWPKTSRSHLSAASSRRPESPTAPEPHAPTTDW